MPSDWAPESKGVMSYGREVEGVRAVTKAGASTTVELMAGSGLKYVHANRKGKDLENSRKQVISIISKINTVTNSFKI